MISGGIKFFEKSKCLLKDGASIVASSADAAADYVLSMNRYYRWDSIGSDDSTPETLTITLPEAATFSRLFIVDHNLKEFDVTYGSGASSFANVVGIDGATTGIDEAAFAQNTAYYEFDAVTTDQINITALKTQTANQEKYITLVTVTNEIGTLVGYPSVQPTLDFNERRSQVQSGKYITQKNYEVFAAKIAMEYTEQDDIDVFATLYEMQDPFLVWLCGGKYGTGKFSVRFKNWRLQDLYQAQTYGNMQARFRSDVYTSSPITTLTMAEEV